MTTTNSLISTAVGIVVAALVTLAVSASSISAGGIRIVAIATFVAFLVNWVAFVPSFLAHTEHYFDITGTMTYLAVIVLSLILADRYDARSVLVTVLVAIWTLRLGIFLFRRVKVAGKDGRFDEMKYRWAWFFMTWTLQGLWVVLTLACAIAIITTDDPKSIGVFAIVGLIVWVVGFAIEAISDQQKSAFKADPVNDGRFITTGLWAWSRHPNYFGEIMLWTGIAIMAIPVLTGWRWVALISPVFVYVLLTRISGLPMLEARGKKRWGAEPAYQDYIANTPVLMMRPPK